MFEKVEKEELTESIIKADMLRQMKIVHSGNKNCCIFAFVALTLIALIVGALIKSIFVRAIFALIAVGAAVLCIVTIILQNKKQKKLMNSDIYVSVSKLLSISYEQVNEVHMQSRYSARRAYFFNFGAGRWRCYPQKNMYPWSRTHSISSSGLISTTPIGKEFFVVTTQAVSDICAIYNTDFFTYNTNK